jgi:pSer/pThr/pTyr-binding forkhead associated (FHA) protein
MITCPNCKQENSDGYIYCLYCGQELKGAAEAPHDEAVPLTNVKKKPASTSVAPGQASSSFVSGTSWGQAVPDAAIPLQPQYSAPLAAESPSVPPPLVPGMPSAAPAVPLSAVASQAPAAEKLCPKCGNPIPAAFAFCGHCGFRMSEIAPAADQRGRTIFMHAPVLIETAPKPIVRLVVVNPDGSDGATFTLGGKELLLGRSKGIMLFPDDKFISPLHARFMLDERNTLKVQDEKSLNGVFVRIKGDRELVPGDLVRIGRQLLRFDDARSVEDIQYARAQGDDSVVLGSPVTGYWGRVVQILEGARAGEVHMLTGDEVTVGREKGEITFPMDGFMSSVHARLFTREGRFFIKDMGSANKTYVRVRDAEALSAGDVLLIGNKLIKIDIR